MNFGVYFVVFSFLALGCTNSLTSSALQQASESEISQNHLVPEPSIVDIDYDEVFVTQTTRLPIQTRSVKLTDILSEEGTQNYFLEDRIVFSEEKENRPDIQLLFETNCLDGRDEKVIRYSGSMDYKSQIDLIELIPPELFVIGSDHSRNHSCGFQFTAQNSGGSTHLFNFPHLPVHSFDQVVHLSLHDKNTDFSKKLSLNEKMVVHFDSMKDQGYYLDVWYDNTIDEIKLSCDFVEHSFYVRHNTRYQLSGIPGWNYIPETQRKDQNCRFFSLREGRMVGVSQSFYLDFKDDNLQTEMVVHMNDDLYNTELLPKLDRSLKDSSGFEEIVYENFLTLKVKNVGDQIKKLYIPTKIKMDKNYYFFWTSYFDRFYKDRKGYLQVSDKIKQLPNYHRESSQDDIFLSLSSQENIEIPLDLIFEKQTMCLKNSKLDLTSWDEYQQGFIKIFDESIKKEFMRGEFKNIDDLVSGELDRDFLSQEFSVKYNFFNNPLGLGVASFMEFKKPRIYEVSTVSNLSLAKKEARVLDEINPNESVTLSYSLDYKRYPQMEESFEKWPDYPTITKGDIIAVYTIFGLESLGISSIYEFIQEIHKEISKALYSTVDLDRKITESETDARRNFDLTKVSNDYGLMEVLMEGVSQKDFFKFNEFNCDYVDMETFLFQEWAFVLLMDFETKEILQSFDRDLSSFFISLMSLSLSVKDFVDVFSWFVSLDSSNLMLSLEDFQSKAVSYMEEKNLNEVSFIPLSYELHGKIPLFLPKKDDMVPRVGQSDEFNRVKNMKAHHENVFSKFNRALHLSSEEKKLLDLQKKAREEARKKRRQGPIYNF